VSRACIAEQTGDVRRRCFRRCVLIRRQFACFAGEYAAPDFADLHSARYVTRAIIFPANNSFQSPIEIKRLRRRHQKSPANRNWHQCRRAIMPRIALRGKVTSYRLAVSAEISRVTKDHKRSTSRGRESIPQIKITRE